MVTIDYPTSTLEYFFELQGSVIIVRSDLMQRNTPITYNSVYDTLVQGHEARHELAQGSEHLCGENSVDHQKVEATATVSIMRCSAVYNTVGNPYAATYRFKGAFTTSSYGFFDDGMSYANGLGDTFAKAWGFRREGDTYHMYMVKYNPSFSRNEWWDFWKVHIPLTGTTARFISGATFAVLPGSYKDIYHMPLDTLIGRPTAAGSLLNYYSYGTADYAYAVFSNPDTSILPTMRRVMSAVSSVVNGLVLTKCPIEDYDYGTLAMEAVDSSRVNKVNMLEFISDLRHPSTMIPKLKNLRNLPTDPKLLRSLRNVSHEYLTLHYGVLPTVDDVKTIYEAARKCAQYYDRNGYIVHTAGRTASQSTATADWNVTQRIKLATATFESMFDSVIQGFDNLGVLPTYENIWDLIPYSFVVDWYVNVGAFLEDYDNLFRLDRLNVKYVTMSKKTTATHTIVDRASGLNASVSVVQYHRWVTRQCPVPKLTFSETSQTTNHWLESGALLITRTKH